jgi:hypothetical protein
LPASAGTPGRGRRGPVATLIAAALLVPGQAAWGESAPGGLASAARGEASSRAASEGLVRYFPRYRLPVRMKCPPDAGAAAGRYRCLKFRGACSEACTVRVRMEVALPGPNIGPEVASDHFEEPELVFRAWIALRRSQLAAIKRHREVARFRTRLSAVSDDGDSDVDRRAFRFRLR